MRSAPAVRRIFAAWLTGLLACAAAWPQDGAGRQSADPLNQQRDEEPPPGPVPNAAEVIAALPRPRDDAGFRARAQIRSDAADGSSRAVQLLLQGRREAGRWQTLIVGMWPDEVKGHTLMLAGDATGTVSGFRFVPPEQVSDLTEADLATPLFGTPLAVEDLLSGGLTQSAFWEWPVQASTGVDRVGRHWCWVLESRREGAGLPMVRSCVAAQEHIPLRIERFDAEGRLSTRLAVDRLVRREDGRWLPAAFTLEDVRSGETTAVRFSRGDGDVTYTPEAFTVSAVRELIGQD